MMTIISLLLLASLLPHLIFTAHVNVGIVNGRLAKHRPYMVSIQLNKEHICGGFLISDQWVLTAAHCWEDAIERCPQFLTAVVGVLDITKSISSNRIKVKKCIPHLESCSGPSRNDIMLLMLDKKIDLNYSVNKIELPKEGEDVKARSNCSVMGWGIQQPNGSVSTHLQEADVFIHNPAVCLARWGTLYIDSQMICVRGWGGTCQGDSGGPLVCGNIAVGITSFGGIECNSPQRPNVYAKISAFLPWIKKNMRNVK
ncbi:complement factor D-like [Carassius carassius]|uniref:complement factor D-like n=1 Tax=Carassius carassius TaxID=217509 RepID=UPI0028696D8C|nr:complement factor D-like [Carassius carassius]